MLIKDPIYKQLADKLRQEILRERFDAGDKFYSERELGQRYKVSRVTVNKAISILISEGYLQNIKGRGYFVKESPVKFDMSQLISLTAMAEKLGKELRNGVIVFEERSIDNIPDGIPQEIIRDGDTEFYYLKRVRFIDNKPLVLDRRLIVKRLCPELSIDNVGASIFEGVEKISGRRIRICDQYIKAVTINNAEAELLQIKGGDACLQLNATVYSEGNNPLWYESCLFNGESFMYHNYYDVGEQAAPANKVFME